MLTIALEQLVCHDEGDGPGNAEPYIWPVFFKVDGETYRVVTDVGFIGSPTIVSTSGHHGNLGTRSVSAGDIVRIPPGVGTYQTDLVPIRILDPTISSLLGSDTIPGVAGVVVVVMEEDGFPAHIARSGYDALVDAVHFAVTRIAAEYQHALAPPTADDLDERIKAVTGTVAKHVKGAVMVDMQSWQLLWFGTFGDQDDRIGTNAWTVLSNELQEIGRIPFSQRWSESDEDEPSEDGDWELRGAFVWFMPLSVRSGLLSRGHPAGSSLRAVMRPETSVWRWLAT
jgi:hypothetical protein